MIIMLHLQEFIEHHENWEELLNKEPYCINIKRKDNRILFKYSMLNSDFNNKIVQECRGLILEDETFNVLCCPFYKFGNYDGAIHSFLDYTELYHNDYIIWSLLGISYIFNKQYEEALEPLLTATELGPSSYFSWYYLGFLYYKSKKYNEAIKTLWKAAKLNIFYFERDDNRYILFYTTNNIYYKNGEYKDTREFFLKSIGIC